MLQVSTDTGGGIKTYKTTGYQASGHFTTSGATGVPFSSTTYLNFMRTATDYVESTAPTLGLNATIWLETGLSRERLPIHGTFAAQPG